MPDELTAVCRECGLPFAWSPRHYRQLGLRNAPRRCPRCRNRKLVEREVVLRLPLVVLTFAIPCWWRDSGDDWKFVQRGNLRGRIDLRTMMNPQPTYGDDVALRIMQSVVASKLPGRKTESHVYAVLEPIDQGARPAAWFKPEAGPAPPRALWATTLEWRDGLVESSSVVPLEG